MSMLKAAASKVYDVETFIANSQSLSALRHRAEKGKKVLMYYPTKSYARSEDGNIGNVEGIIGVTGAVHEWTSGNTFNSTICTHGVRRETPEGVLLNSGTCPMCEVSREVRDCIDQLVRQEEEKPGFGLLSKKDKEKKLSDARDNKPLGYRKDYLYILIVVFELSENQCVIDSDTGLPKFKLEVQRMASSRAKKIRETIENTGETLEGCFVVVQYGDTDHKGSQVSQSTISVRSKDKTPFAMFPELRAKVDEAVDAFSFEGIEKYYYEWAGLTDEAMQKIVDKQLASWREYVKMAEKNPGILFEPYKTYSNVGGEVAGISASAASYSKDSRNKHTDVPSVVNEASVDMSGLEGGTIDKFLMEDEEE